MTTVALGQRWRSRDPDGGPYDEVVVTGAWEGGEYALRPANGSAQIIAAAPDLLQAAYDLVSDPREQPARLVTDGGDALSAWSAEVKP